MQEPEILPLGIDGILVRFARAMSEEANARAISFCDQVKSANVGGVTEVASSLVSVRVAFDPRQVQRTQLTEVLDKLLSEPATQSMQPRRLWRIPTAFGPDYAPQLQEAAALAGLSEADAITQITQATVVARAIGFAPGQPYLGLLPEAFDIPRRETLADGVPRGAMICAVRQLILWAADAPTGWRHIGQTAFEVYRPHAADPFAFEPGDTVQFEAVSDDTMRDLIKTADANGGATCEVMS